MYSTTMLKAIEELREQYSEPPSHMDIIRKAVMTQYGRINQPEMPEILDEKQRNIFMKKIDLLAGFLESENGADAIELLVNAFEHYCEEMEKKETEADD